MAPRVSTTLLRKEEEEKMHLPFAVAISVVELINVPRSCTWFSWMPSRCDFVFVSVRIWRQVSRYPANVLSYPPILSLFNTFRQPSIDSLPSSEEWRFCWFLYLFRRTYSYLDPECVISAYAKHKFYGVISQGLVVVFIWFRCLVTVRSGQHNNLYPFLSQTK